MNDQLAYLRYQFDKLTTECSIDSKTYLDDYERVTEEFKAMIVDWNKHKSTWDDDTKQQVSDTLLLFIIPKIMQMNNLFEKSFKEKTVQINQEKKELTDEYFALNRILNKIDD